MPDESPTLTPPVSESRDHILGSHEVTVTLLEYGDFECPYCGHAHEILKELREQLGDQFRLVFRHFPLSQIHPHAQHAADAAEFAAPAGRFWEMHDLLFENQQALEDEDLARYAADLHLDVSHFPRAFADNNLLNRIRQDFASGVKSGVNGTPTFFINGLRHDGSWDLPDLLAAIRDHADLPHHAPSPRRRR